MTCIPSSPKQLGEWAEVCFLARVLAIGHRISKPYGDNAPYDFIVDSGSRLTRVQVKSVAAQQQNCFHIAMGHGLRKRSYRRRELDLLAAYIIPYDAWYLIPFSQIGRTRSLVRASSSLPPQIRTLPRSLAFAGIEEFIKHVILSRAFRRRTLRLLFGHCHPDIRG